ncbi:MAG: radical SAM protein, partial [Gemmatimonadetes bacterium]|nr:radical SAM protein [Gemmatimonadota bacterium]NNM07156.1 radical SAM protein [Gemmatimonadota bacterium]
MRYEGRMWRPPSEAQSYILQATIGCSHNLCTYCDMYRDKEFRERNLAAVLLDIDEAGRMYPGVTKVFVADGDALVMGVSSWLSILLRLRSSFPSLRRVSCYATAQNVLEKSEGELRELREEGLSLIYIGPESGDDVTLKRIVKGNTFQDHAEAAQKAHAAGMKVSVIMLLGAGGVDRTEEHAGETARLVTEMDPEYLSALTLSVIPGTPLHRMMEKGKFELPSIEGLLRELRTIVAESEPTRAIFRTNHASNYLSLAGRLPRDRDAIVAEIDSALRGEVPLRPEYF